jgi:hypothetical protein
MRHKFELEHLKWAANCEICGARVDGDELTSLMANYKSYEVPGCPGPREATPASSPAARMELIHQLLADRDPLTGEPREPLITTAQAMKLIDLAAADERVRFPNRDVIFPNGSVIRFEGTNPGEPVLDEVTAFDNVGPFEVRAFPMLPPGKFVFVPPTLPGDFEKEMEAVRERIAEYTKKLSYPFFAGVDFGKPEEEEPLILTFPQMKQLDKLAAQAATQPGTWPCASCGNALAPSQLFCVRCYDKCCAPPPVPPANLSGGLASAGYPPLRCLPRQTSQPLAAAPAPRISGCASEASAAEPCICFGTRSRHCRAHNHEGES